MSRVWGRGLEMWVRDRVQTEERIMGTAREHNYKPEVARKAYLAVMKDALSSPRWRVVDDLAAYESPRVEDMPPLAVLVAALPRVNKDNIVQSSKQLACGLDVVSLHHVVKTSLEQKGSRKGTTDMRDVGLRSVIFLATHLNRVLQLNGTPHQLRIDEVST